MRALDVKVGYPSRGASEHPQCRGDAAQAAPGAAVDGAAGVSRGDVRSEPRVVWRRVSGRCRDGIDTGVRGPLTGPAYLVSHGGESFPDIVVVLQGEGVTIELVGNVFISKTGVTSATFAHVPDAPISAFELELCRWARTPRSSAVGSLCAGALSMPTTITGQNGARGQADHEDQGRRVPEGQEEGQAQEEAQEAQEGQEGQSAR